MHTYTYISLCDYIYTYSNIYTYIKREGEREREREIERERKRERGREGERETYRLSYTEKTIELMNQAFGRSEGWQYYKCFLSADFKAVK